MLATVYQLNTSAHCAHFIFTFQAILQSFLVLVLLSPIPTLSLESIMSYSGSMFLVRQGCPYRPPYYRDSKVLDQATVEQYRDCLKTASPSQVMKASHPQIGQQFLVSALPAVLCAQGVVRQLPPHDDGASLLRHLLSPLPPAHSPAQAHPLPSHC